jgi:hypothetical protein
VNGAFLVVDAQGVTEVTVGHHLGGAALVVLVLAFDFAERGGVVSILQRAEHASPIDAR